MEKEREQAGGRKVAVATEGMVWSNRVEAKVHGCAQEA